MRILIVEDESSLLSLISKRLKEEGYSVDIAKNGRDARDYIFSVDYDCIVLDLMIPVKGVFVKSVLDGYPAQKAGIKTGDILSLSEILSESCILT